MARKINGKMSTVLHKDSRYRGKIKGGAPSRKGKLNASASPFNITKRK